MNKYNVISKIIDSCNLISTKAEDIAGFAENARNFSIRIDIEDNAVAIVNLDMDMLPNGGKYEIQGEIGFI